jgi:hypothetical protein
MPLTLLLALAILGLVLIVRTRGHSDGASDPDAATLRSLERAGSDLGRSHEMEFFLYLPDQSAAEAAGAQLRAEGFTTRVSPGEASGDWLCLATRTMQPSLDELHRLRRHLTAVAESRDGAYDGWGATVVTEDEAG